MLTSARGGGCPMLTEGGGGGSKKAKILLTSYVNAPLHIIYKSQCRYKTKWWALPSQLKEMSIRMREGSGGRAGVHQSPLTRARARSILLASCAKLIVKPTYAHDS